MLRDIPRMIMTVLGVLFLIVIIFYYTFNNLNQDSAVKSIQDVTETSIFRNKDDSARVKEGTFVIDRKSFENEFKANYVKYKNMNKEDAAKVAFTFDYLPNAGTKDRIEIKGVRVKVKEGRDTYQATYVVNVAAD